MADKAREKALKQSLTELEGKQVAFSKSSVTLRQLEREHGPAADIAMRGQSDTSVDSGETRERLWSTG